MSKRSTAGALLFMLAGVLAFFSVAAPWWAATSTNSAGASTTLDLRSGSTYSVTQPNGTSTSYSYVGGSAPLPATGNETNSAVQNVELAGVLSFVCGVVAAIPGVRQVPRRGMAAGIAVLGILAWLVAMWGILGFAVNLSGAMTTDYLGVTPAPPWSTTFYGSESSNGIVYAWGPSVGWGIGIGTLILILPGTLASFRSLVRGSEEQDRISGALPGENPEEPRVPAAPRAPSATPKPAATPLSAQVAAQASRAPAAVPSTSRPTPSPWPATTPRPTPAPAVSEPTAPPVPTPAPSSSWDDPGSLPYAPGSSEPAPAASSTSPWDPYSTGSEGYAGSPAPRAPEPIPAPSPPPAPESEKERRVREALYAIVAERRDQVLSNPKVLRGLLADHCPDCVRPIAIIMAAVDEGVPSTVLEAQEGGRAVDRAALVDDLVERRGLAPESSEWAVRAWVQALRPL